MAYREQVRGDDAHARIRYRTPTQLGMLERMHRTLKEEGIYWRLYEDPAHARLCLGNGRVEPGTIHIQQVPSIAQLLNSGDLNEDGVTNHEDLFISQQSRWKSTAPVPTPTPTVTPSPTSTPTATP